MKDIAIIKLGNGNHYKIKSFTDTKLDSYIEEVCKNYDGTLIFRCTVKTTRITDAIKLKYPQHHNSNDDFTFTTLEEIKIVVLYIVTLCNKVDKVTRAIGGVRGTKPQRIAMRKKLGTKGQPAPIREVMVAYMRKEYDFFKECSKKDGIKKLRSLTDIPRTNIYNSYQICHDFVFDIPVDTPQA